MVRKPSSTIASDAALKLLDGPGHGVESAVGAVGAPEGAVGASEPFDEDLSVQLTRGGVRAARNRQPHGGAGASALTAAGEAAKRAALEAEVPSRRRRSAAARAAAFQNAKVPKLDTAANVHGLHGRSKGAAGAAAEKPKRYSKKNKPGTAASAAAQRYR